MKPNFLVKIIIKKLRQLSAAAVTSTSGVKSMPFSIGVLFIEPDMIMLEATIHDNFAQKHTLWILGGFALPR